MPYDGHLRLAMELYTRAITQALAGRHAGSAPSSTCRSPGGSALRNARARAARQAFRYGGYEIIHPISMSDLVIRGLRNRYRRGGIGAPLGAGHGVEGRADDVDRAERQGARSPRCCASTIRAARWTRRSSAAPSSSTTPTRRRRHRARAQGPAGLRAVGRARLSARGRAGLGLRDRRLPPRRFQLSQERGQSVHDAPVSPRPHPGGLRARNGVEPGALGRDDQRADRATRCSGSRYQFWYFLYNTGNPVGVLRHGAARSAAARRRDVDPERHGPGAAPDGGHRPQPGRPAHQADGRDSGDAFWDASSGTCRSSRRISLRRRGTCCAALFVEPLPFVTGVVFICDAASRQLPGRELAGHVRPPAGQHPGCDDASVAGELGHLREQSTLRGSTVFRPPTAIDNMDRSKPGLRTLASLPIAPGVAGALDHAVKGNARAGTPMTAWCTTPARTSTGSPPSS